MALINPIFGLPFSAVDRVSDNEEKKKKRDQKQKTEESGRGEKKIPEEENQTFGEQECFTGQLLDTQTIVKLIQAHLECQKAQENSMSSASNLYNHVKNIARASQFNRSI